ncbi:MAG: rubrerythrin family protein [Clostridia bacterium]|nr:rubrerythrin family protein [Clostridia bacterium]
MKLKDSKTYLNLAKAYAGECMARTRYEFVEYGARKEGYKNIADLIDTIAYQEFNHARMMYTFLQTAEDGLIDNIDISSGYPFRQKWNLLENLRISAQDEANEAELVYPEYARIAEKEGFPDIAGLFKNLIQIETCHKMMFTQLYEQMRDGKLYKKDAPVKWKCADCGYEFTGTEAFEDCPVCHAKQGSILLILDS